MTFCSRFKTKHLVNEKYDENVIRMWGMENGDDDDVMCEVLASTINHSKGTEGARATLSSLDSIFRSA